MRERRKHERFEIDLPARVEVMTTGGKQILDLSTKNVCAGGAFFTTHQTIALGTNVRVKLAVSSRSLRDRTGVETLVQLEGVVMRIEPTGVAIRFSKDYKIMKLQDPSSI
jgi:hypothetical protein